MHVPDASPVMNGISRRRLLALLAWGAGGPVAMSALLSHAQSVPYAFPSPDNRLAFPRDEGSHPAFRVEWWYVTGWLEAGKRELGFQVTFFRIRKALPRENPSAFAPTQMLVGHAALSDPVHGRLIRAERAARIGLSLVEAAAGKTDVRLDRWSIRQQGTRYVIDIDDPALTLRLELQATQPPLVHGEAGYSRKGPGPQSASHYYSHPHMSVRGEAGPPSGRTPVTGTAWFDHEWSSQFLETGAAGWDWIGINLDGGAALMAFRIRDAAGQSQWAGGTLRENGGRVTIFQPKDVGFQPGRTWKSPRTGVTYPVVWTIRAGGRTYAIAPLMDDQENDTRATTGAIYWEGAVRCMTDGKTVGRGYLELTGYGGRLSV